MLFTAVLTKIIGALFKIPLSQDYCLGDLGFGYFSAAYDLYTPISTLAISGFPLAISQIIANFSAQGKFAEISEVFKSSKKVLLIISLAELFLISAIIVPFSNLTDSSGNGIYSLAAILPAVIISAFLSLYRGYFEGFSNMKPPAVSNIIEALGKLFLGFSFAFITLKITNNVALAAAGALLGISVGLLISLAYISVKYKKSIGTVNSRTHDLSEDFSSKGLMRDIFAVMLPVGLSSLAGSFVSLIDTLTVRVQLTAQINAGDSVIAEIYKSLMNDMAITSDSLLPTVLYGIKGKAFTLFNIVLTLTMALGVSAVPTIANLKSKNDKEGMLNNANASLKITTLVCFPVSAGFIAVGEELMSLLYGNDLSSVIGGKMLAIYGIATVFAGVSIVLGNILQGMGSNTAVFKNICAGVLIKVIFNLILTAVPTLNIYGCCISTFICYLYIFVMHLIYLYKSCKKLPERNIFLKPLAAAVSCGISAFAITRLSSNSLIIMLSIIVAAVVYFAVLLLLKFFSLEDFVSLPFAEKIIHMCKKLKKVCFLSEK